MDNWKRNEAGHLVDEFGYPVELAGLFELLQDEVKKLSLVGVQVVYYLSKKENNPWTVALAKASIVTKKMEEGESEGESEEEQDRKSEDGSEKMAEKERRIDEWIVQTISAGGTDFAKAIIAGAAGVERILVEERAGDKERIVVEGKKGRRYSL